jgi:hypothetical protein
MESLQWLQLHMPFLNSEWFTYLYSLVVFANPFALFPQLTNVVRAEPKELKGVSVFMFFIFLAIQTMVSLGGIKVQDPALFLSMAISVVETAAIIIIVLVRRVRT